MKHTPGPWNVGAPYISRNKEHIPVLAYQTICITWPLKENATEEDKANAKLIAAAPELLEALKLITRKVQPCRPDSVIEDIIKIAEAAIKKATE